jgi:hypothetical protein
MLAGPPEEDCESSPDEGVATMRSIEILLDGILDYAGLFPPADLEMSQAVARYNDYRNGPDSWMLGRFICPVARLSEFERNARHTWHNDLDAQPWKVSCARGRRNWIPISNKSMSSIAACS